MSTPITAQEQVLARIAMAQRLGGLYHSEAVGLIRALYHAPPPTGLFPDALHQQACERGYRDGRTILEVEAQLAAEAIR